MGALKRSLGQTPKDQPATKAKRVAAKAAPKKAAPKKAAPKKAAPGKGRRVTRRSA